MSQIRTLAKMESVAVLFACIAGGVIMAVLMESDAEVSKRGLLDCFRGSLS